MFLTNSMSESLTLLPCPHWLVCSEPPFFNWAWRTWTNLPLDTIWIIHRKAVFHILLRLSYYLQSTFYFNINEMMNLVRCIILFLVFLHNHRCVFNVKVTRPPKSFNKILWSLETFSRHFSGINTGCYTFL